MRKSFFVILVLAVIARGSSAGVAPRKITVGVLPFQTPENFETLASLASAHVRSELLESPRYEVIEEERMAAVMKQIAATHRLDYTQKDAIEAGKLVAARYMIFGEVISVEMNPPGAMFACDLSAALRLVQVESGVVLFQRITTIHGNQPAWCLQEALGELSCELLKSASLAGIVVEVSDREHILVDLGSRDGIKSGQRLVVQREGGVLIHPTTGKEIRRPDTACGDVEIESVGEETSIARPVKSKDSDIRSGDRVLLPITANCSRVGSFLRQGGTSILRALTKGIK